jgi:glycoprotein-N-acetylgalactosamine 3-beta-galactosyltransferase
MTISKLRQRTGKLSNLAFPFSYIIIENLRYMLAQYRPQTALYFGHRYAVQGLNDGYMAGGGYILSRKAVTKFVETALPNKTQCHTEGGSEDWEMGRCLEGLAIFIDARDELHQKRFFPVGVGEHMKDKADPEYWYTRNQYYHVTQGNISCCSDTSIEYHYIGTKEMYLLDYFIYGTHPFGVDDHLAETLPKRLPLKTIMKAADANSSSPNFRVHRLRHQLDPSEKY